MPSVLYDGAEAVASAILDQAPAPPAVQKTLTIDHLNHVRVDGVKTTKTRLTTKEAQILRAIMRRSGVATKEFLLLELYNGRDEPEQKIVDVFTCKLRAKLGDHRDAIVTSWGRGYVRGEGYVLEDNLHGMTVSTRCRELLDAVADEAQRSPDELGEELLTKALQAYRKQLWDDPRASEAVSAARAGR